MPSPDGMIIFLIIGGSITVSGSCYNWEWYWNWGGRVLESSIGHSNLRKVHFIVGLIFISVAVGIWSNNYISANILIAGILGVVVASMFGKIIYDLSYADFSIDETKSKNKSKSDNSESYD